MTLGNSNGESSKTGAFLNAFNQRSPTSGDFTPPTPTRSDPAPSRQATTTNDIRDPSPALETKDNGRYVVWRANQHDIFELWWKSTPFYAEELQQNSIGHPHWASSIRTAPVWNHYIQVADSRTGQPFVMCCICQTVLGHPNTRNTGTSTMKHHQRTSFCKKHRQLGSKHQRQLTAFELQVWYIVFRR